MAKFPGNKKSKGIVFALVVLIVVAVMYVSIVPNLPTAAPVAKADDITPQVANDAITWPSYGQEAIGVQDVGVLQTNGQQVSHPIASIAKLMLALLVLQQKPLQLNQTGPTLTMTQADVDLYNNYLSQNGSVVPVDVGEQLTEYQMLEALLLPSGDNIADSLADWAYGSTANYLTAANAEAAKLGMKETHFADPSGLSPQTVSSAQNLVILGSKILDQPVLAQIVSEPQVTLPVVGIEYNVDSLLGQNNIIGVKTGNTDEAGGCFLFAVTTTSATKQNYTVIGAILGGPSLTSVLSDTTAFLQNNALPVDYLPAATAGQTIGTYTTAWGQVIGVVAKNNLPLYVAGNQPVKVKVTLNKLTGAVAKGTVVGEITAQTGQTTLTDPLTLASNLTKPRISWHLLHP